MSTSSSSRAEAVPPSRRRRRILLGGGLALALVAAGGAIEGIPRAERDLERRVDRRLADHGITGVHSTFSGQDGTLHCDAPLTDPAAARSLAEHVWGVRVAHLASSCSASGSGAAAPATTTVTTVTTEASSTTAAPAPASTTVTTTVTTTASTAAPTTVAPTTTDAAAGDDVTVALDAGRLVLTGTVADEASHTALVDAATAVVDPANVDDRITVDAALDGDTTAIGGLAGLVASMPDNLVSGSATLADGALAIDGVYVDAAAQQAVDAAATAAGADAMLSPRPTATATDAAALTDELNAFVGANPILFDPGKATLTAAASAVVAQVAAIAQRYAGVTIDVIGHTDSDGDPGRNQRLSEQRAAAVRDALVARGVTAPLTSSGRGETEPVLVNGAEDKAASRRVVFAVTAA